MKMSLIMFLMVLCNASFSQKKFIQLENLFNELKKNNDFNGNVLVAENGNPIFNKSYGIENEKRNTKLSSQSIFCLASITKQFTSTAIILLNKQGKINFNDKLKEYFPELEFYSDVTIHNLLTHTSGLPDYEHLMSEYWDKRKIATNKDVIDVLIKYKPKNKLNPNEKFEYCNTNYMLLASIVEKISNQKFDDFLQKNIFKPLKMSNTFIFQRRYKPRDIENMTIGYSLDSLQRKITPDDFGEDFFIVYLDGLYGGGRLFSTTEDLLKWDRALYSESILSNSDKEKVFSNNIINNRENTNYGYGWMIDHNSEYGKIVYHSGRWGGYITYIERHLKSDKTIIILQNMETEKTLVPISRVRDIIYDKLKNVSLEILKEYRGEYLTKDGKTKRILMENGKLYIPMNPSVKLELLPTSENKFIVDGFSPTVSYEFLRNATGNVTSYRVVQEETQLDQIVKKVNN